MGYGIHQMPIFDSPNKIDKVALETIKNDFFVGNPVSAIVDFEGQGINEQGDYVLGCRAGPSIHISNLIHEMAHLAEREIPKLLEKPYKGWGFSFGKYWEFGGRSGHEPNTDQSVLRELRVWAFQWSIQQHYKIKDKESKTIFDLVSSIVWLPAFVYFKHKRISKEERELLKYDQSEKKAIELAAEEVRIMSNTDFTFECFCDNWFTRMKILKKRRLS